MAPSTPSISDGQNWEVCCASIHYFEAEQAVDGAGNPREHQRGGAMVISPRRMAHMGEIVALSAAEAARLLRLEAIQVPGSKALPGSPGSEPRATPFSTPVLGAARFDGDRLGDPRPPAEVVGKPRLPEPGSEPAPEPPAPDETLDLETADAEEIAAWISGEKPEPWTEDVIVGAAGDDPSIAQKLLEAEEIATRGSPRKGVSKRLTAIFQEDE